MLPERFFSPPRLGSLAEAKQAMNREQLEKAKSFYYSLMGWNPDTGVPTAEKLESFSLGHLADAVTR
jgi:aldehyde:ferredoxin oxidoreductase